MRIRRPLIVSAVAGVLLFLPGCTLGPIQGLSFGEGSLGLQGASVVVPEIVTCQKGWNVAFGDVSVAQADDHRLAQGFGSFENAFPGVPCTGSPQSFNVTVFNGSPWTFETGTAAADGDVFVFNPVSGELVSKAVDPVEIHISKHDPQPNPSRAAQPARDPRFPQP